MAAVCDPKLLPAQATCFHCADPGTNKEIQLYLFGALLGNASAPTLSTGAATYRPITGKWKTAVEVYLMAVLTGNSTDPATLEKAAACWWCIPESERLQVSTYLLAVTAGASTDPKVLAKSIGPYESLLSLYDYVKIYALNFLAGGLSLNALMKGAACFMCLDVGRLEEIYLYLLCQGVLSNLIPGGSRYNGATEFDLVVLANTNYLITWGSNDLSMTLCGTSFPSLGVGAVTAVNTGACTLMQFFGTFAGTTVTVRVQKIPMTIPTPTGFTWVISGANAVAGWDTPPGGVFSTEIWTSTDGTTFTLAGTVATPGTSFSTAKPGPGTLLYAKIRWTEKVFPGVSQFTAALSVDPYEPVCGTGVFDAADYFNNSLAKGCGWASAGVTTAGAFAQFTFQNESNIWQLGGVLDFDWRRTLAMGNNWNRLRIACLYTNTATAGAALLDIWLGVTNANHALQSAGGNMVGMQYGGGVNWSYTVDGAGDYISPGATDRFAVTCVNNVFNNVTFGTQGVMQVRSSLHRSLVVVDIIKGNPNYTVRCYRPNLITDSQQDFTFADLVTAMGLAENANMTISGKTLAVFSQPIAFSETNGNVDSVEFRSAGTGTLVGELIGIGVKKLA